MVTHADEPSPFAGTSAVASLARTEGQVTLVQGQSFVRSGRAGDIVDTLPQGLFVLDTRFLSRWELTVNGSRLEPLVVEVPEPFSATFVARGAPSPGRADANLVVFRRRHVGRGMRERITVTNHGLTTTALTVRLRCDVDFADLFQVKESRVTREGRHSQEEHPRSLRYGHSLRGVTKHAVMALSVDAEVEPNVATWHTTLPPRGAWQVCIDLTVRIRDHDVEPRFRCGGDDADAVPTRHLDQWRATTPVVHTDDAALAVTLQQSERDLGALRIFDPDHPELPVLAAGAPWFMTVFGRDTLLTAWMSLLADSSLARGALATLARLQGEEVVAETEEEPGKILHEIRFGRAAGLSLGAGDIYYGTIDASPLFVMLLGELWRWEGDREFVEQMLPHADRALEWIERHGDRDGDGYVEYQRSTERGLANQGWKDSWDAIRFADGRLADAPIALCEVQGYVYAAYRARAELARDLGDTACHDRWSRTAADLRTRFNTDFWLEGEGTFALGLDGDKRPIDAVTSNVGHCLWTGIVDARHAESVATRLLGDDTFSGFGVRTLARSMAAYNPVSYHNGSVWPHDNAICAAGLVRYGLEGPAHRIIAAQLDVAAAAGGALPELFAGFDRSHLSTPAAYPTSCSPQAWAAASPLLWLRTLLGLDPSAAAGQIRLRPRLLPRMDHLQVAGIRVAGRALTVDVVGDDVRIDGASGLDVVIE